MSNSDMNYVKGFDLFGVKAKQIPCLTGNGEPTANLALKIGLLYVDEDNGDMYKCVKGNGEEGLVWVLVNNKDTNTDSGQNPTVELDTTLTQSGKAADAKATGERIAEVERKTLTAGGAAVVLISTELRGCDLSNHTMLHTLGTAYETEINPRDHHVVGSVYVEVGGVDVTKDVYDPETDTVSISAPTADILIEAFCPEKQPEKTVDLVLFSGQSNMSGRGDGSIATVCPAGEGYWYKDGELTQITGYFGNEGSTSSGSMVSSVAKAYFDSCGVPIVAISHSSGGTKISQFLPGGTPYTNGVELYNEAVAYLEAQGYTVRHRAMVWNQGESDAHNGVSQADYEAAFLTLRDNLKTDCGITEFFVVEIGQYKTDLAMYDEIKAAQEHLTATEPDIIMASRKFIGATGLMKDTWHYTQPAYNIVGRDTGIHMAYYYATGIGPRVTEFAATDMSDQNSPVVSDELDATEWDYTLHDALGVVSLDQYIGSAEHVTVKASYKVNGATYPTAIGRSIKTGTWVSVFGGNTTLKTVTFEDGVVLIQNGNLNACNTVAMFDGCTSLERVTNIPPMLEGGGVDIRTAQSMYSGCTALVSAELPRNTIIAEKAFRKCRALTEFGDIPDTVTNAKLMFDGAGLAHCPDVPASVTNCEEMCRTGNTVVSAGVIRANTSSIAHMFAGQKQLAGTVRIESTGITDMTGAFWEDAIPNITFEVPAGSTTYNTLMAAYPTANVVTF